MNKKLEGEGRQEGRDNRQPTTQEARQPTPEEMLRATEQALLLDVDTTITRTESFLNRDDFTMRQIAASFRNLDEVLPRQAQMRRRVGELFDSHVRPLLKEIGNTGDKVRSMRTGVHDASELTPDAVQSLVGMREELQQLAGRAQEVVEAVAGTAQRIVRWADDGMSQRILDPHAGDEIMGAARRLQHTVEKLMEENIDFSKRKFAALCEAAEDFLAAKASVSPASNESEGSQGGSETEKK